MKRLILTLLAALMMTVWAAAYDDVPEGHWAAEAVAELTEQRIVTGYPDDTFRPDDPVSRAQFAAMVLRACSGEEIPRASGDEAWWQPYYDLADDALLWYLGPVDDGWVQQFAEPAADDMNRPVIRYEAAVMLAHAESRLNGLWQFNGAAAPDFADAADFPAHYADYVGWAAECGFVAGYGDGTYRGSRTVTRAEACVMVQRLICHAGLVGDGERAIFFDNRVLIKYQKNASTVRITSLHVPDRREIQVLTASLPRQIPACETDESWDQTLWTGQDGMFYGLIGLYEYDMEGKLRCITPRPVIDWCWSEEEGSYLIVSASAGSPTYFSGGGVTAAVGNQVFRIDQDGRETMLLSHRPAHGLQIAEIAPGADGAVELRAYFMDTFPEDGQEYVRAWSYALEDGRLRILPPPEYPYYGNACSPEEMADEQARLDKAGVGAET